MKKIFVLVLSLMMMVGAAFATPRLEGNKIYLDEAVTSLFTAEQFIENVGGEEVLDIPDEVGNTKRMQLELFCNPNKVIEFATEDLATFYYNTIMEANLQPNDLYLRATDHYENLDFWLFMTFFEASQYEYEIRDGKKVVTGFNTKTTPVYCYVGE